MNPKSPSISHPIRFLLGKFPWHVLALFLAILVQAFLTGIFALAIAPIADLVLNSGGGSSKVTAFVTTLFNSLNIPFSLSSLLITTSFVVLLSGISSVITKYVSALVKFDVLQNLLSESISDLLNANYSFLQSERIGVLLSSFQKEVDKIGDIFGQSISAVVAVIQIAILFAVPFLINPTLALGFAVAGIVATSPLWLLHRISDRLGMRSTATMNRVSSILHELLTSLKLIIAFGRSNQTLDRYRSAYKAHAQAAVLLTTLVGGVSALVVPIGTIAVLFVFYHAHIESTEVGDIALTLFAFMKILPQLGTVLKIKVTIEGFIPAFQQVTELNNRAVLARESSAGRDIDNLHENISFEDVHFSYAPGLPLIRGLSMKIKKGQTVAIVGASGSGKTTICDLLLGLYTPDEGSILIDGTPLKDIAIPKWREMIGYVPQDSQLFDTTIRKNLHWGQSDLTEDAINSACDQANALGFISRLPNGLDTVVGDRGSKLSGGQRQRIALARALCRSPKILILDEATSSLDIESENSIKAALNKLHGSITIIIVAHRLETIKGVDYVFRFDKGLLTDQGRYAPLFSDHSIDG